MADGHENKTFLFFIILMILPGISTLCDNFHGAWSSKVKNNDVEYFHTERHHSGKIIFKNIDGGKDYLLHQHEIKTYEDVSHFQIVEKKKCKMISLPDGTLMKKEQNINYVHVVYMNHLDVGYNTNQNDPFTGKLIPGFVNNVLNFYFEEYFPRAVKIGKDLELLGLDPKETFIYTTHPWLVSLYLDCLPNLVLAGVKLKCPTAQNVSDFVYAINKGYITWHAGPLNQQAEASESTLYDFSLQLSEDLYKKFKIVRNFKTMSQRDVPGMTQGAISYLEKHNIKAVSFGVNWASATPAVPSVNVWNYGSHSVITMWHKGGYPNPPGPDPSHPGGLSRKDCTIVDGLSHALCFAFRTDNYGPPKDLYEIIRYQKILKKQFPGATIKASTLDDFTKVLYPLRNKLPRISGEIGDTWIQGITDPIKIAKSRAIYRARSKCVLKGNCDIKSPSFYNSSRLLLKLPEHTYGLASTNDNRNWTNKDFNLNRKSSAYVNCTKAWVEQRAFNDLVVDALGSAEAGLKTEIENEFQNLKPTKPNLVGFVQTTAPYKTGIDCSQFFFKLDHFGAINFLNDSLTGKTWANAENTLAKILYRTYNEEDFKVIDKYYNYGKAGQNVGIQKKNMDKYAKPASQFWYPQVAATYIKNSTENICKSGIYVKLKFTSDLPYTYYGAPKELWLKYYTEDGFDLSIDFLWFNKSATRLAEAIFLSFEPIIPPRYKWYVEKLGSLIDPMNVVQNGSQYQHGIGKGVYLHDGFGIGIGIQSKDVSVVSVITKTMPATVFPAPLAPLTEQPKGMAYNIYNNIWDTNFIFWYPFLKEDGAFKSRYKIVFE